MADIRKKSRFRAVEFGEGVGALPLLLIGARIGDRIADLPRQQVEKCLVVRVQTLMGVESGYEDRRGLVPGGKNDRDQARSGGRHRPATRGEVAEPRLQILDADRRPGPHDLAERPGVAALVLPQHYLFGACRAPRLDPSSGHQTRPIGFGRNLVEQGKRQVERVLGHRIGRPPAGRGEIARPARAGGEIADGAQTPFPDNFFGGLLDRREDAAHAAGFVLDRAVGKAEIPLFRISVAFQQ